MLPCGEPPGTGRGVDLELLTLTDIVRPYRKAEVQATLMSLAPRDLSASKHFPWSIRLKAFSKSTLSKLAADWPSSIAVKTAFQLSIRKCSVPHPFNPPNCRSLSLISERSLSSTKDSRTLLKRGVEDRFLSSDKLEGELFLGITVTVSFFQVLGQLRVSSVWLKIIARGIASMSQNLLASWGLISPTTRPFGFLNDLSLDAIWYGSK